MKFLISVIDDLSDSGTSDEMEAIDIFNDRLRLEGHWVFAGGLTAPNNAVVIDNRNGANLLSSGPLFESKENVSGFWIVEAPSLGAAQTLAFEGSKSCNRKVELRPFLG
jgi:hypothetical protein